MEEEGWHLPPRAPHVSTGLSELSHLVLDQTRVSDRGLAELLLAALPALSHLSLNQTGVTEGTLRLLPQCVPQLRELSLKQTGVSEELGGCSDDSFGSLEWGDSGVLGWGDTFPTAPGWCSQITDVSSLRHLEALQRLYLDSTRVSEASLGALSSHPALCCLMLSGVHSIDGNRALELVSGTGLSWAGEQKQAPPLWVGQAAFPASGKGEGWQCRAPVHSSRGKAGGQ